MNQTVEQVIPLSHVLTWAVPWSVGAFIIGIGVYLVSRHYSPNDVVAQYDPTGSYLGVIGVTLLTAAVSIPIVLYTTLNPNEISKQQGSEIAQKYCAEKLNQKPSDIQMLDSFPKDTDSITKPSICVWDLVKVQGGTISRHKTYEVRVQFLGTTGETVKK